MRNRIILIFMLVFMAVTAVSVNGRFLISKLQNRTEEETSESAIVSSDQKGTLVEELKDMPIENLFYKDSLVELSGSILKTLHVRGYYKSSAGISVTSNGYVIGGANETTTDYEVEEMTAFKEYLDDKGIQLLYVNEPTKYIDDTVFFEEFGQESYSNSNADLFLSRLSEQGISCMDLRDDIEAQNLNSFDLFYHSDHHWTVPTSKWAAELIAEKLNEDFGYTIDLQDYDDDAFYSVTYENAWLGEQGKKLAKSYIGLDDYTMMEPLYDTSYTVYDDQGTVVEENQSFTDTFIDQTRYDLEADPYTALSWHYSYNSWANHRVHNNNVDEGKILVIGDSYESSMLPFLSLGISDVTCVVMRNLGETSIRTIIESGDYDTVIVAYAQFMIGAHDNPDSANYGMFTFD